MDLETADSTEAGSREIVDSDHSNQKYSGSVGFQDPVGGHFSLHAAFNRFQKFDHVMEKFNEHAGGLVPLHPLC